MDKQIRVFQKNEVVFKEGVYERSMYHICAGKVSIYVNYGETEEKLLTTLEAGQYFGEIGITEILPRSATAVAVEDGTELAEITSESFGDYFKNDPETLLAIMRNMSGRLRALTQDYLNARAAISEAVDTAKKGEKQSESLVSKLAKMIQNAVSPYFLKSERILIGKDFTRTGADSEYSFRTFTKNEVIFREGSESDCMYDIQWGSVGIYANYGTENQELLAELKSEEFFGEMGLIDELPRSATAVALENNTKVKVISEELFGKYLEEKPTKVLMIMMHLSSRIRALTKDYMAACAMAEAAAKAKKDDEFWADQSTLDYIDRLYNVPTDPMSLYNHYKM